jgi:hypothetical protein
MNAVLQNLLTLQGLEFGGALDKTTETQAADLRGLIPAPFLGHYDRLRARGKKGLALVRNQVCTGCHMRQPVGKITIVMRGEDIQLCDTCGRYLYLDESAPSEMPTAVVEVKSAPKAAKKPRKAKALAAAA